MADLTSVIQASIKDLPGRATDPDYGGDPQEAVGDEIEAEGGEEGGEPENVAEAGEEGATSGTVEEGEGAISADPAKDAAKVAGEEKPEGDPTEEVDELGVPKHKKGGENRIPQSRVRVIATNAQQRAIEALTGRRMEKDQKLEDFAATFKASVEEKDTTIADQRSRIEQVDAVERIMATDEEAFIEMLTKVYPNYKKYFGQGRVMPAEIAADMPKPDLDLGDGKVTYSLEGIQKLREWDREQILKEMDARMEKRFRPLDEKERMSRVIEGGRPKAAAALEHARTNWEGFADSEKEIEALLVKDTQQAMKEAQRTGRNPSEFLKYTMETAYAAIVFPKHKKAEAEIRKKALEDAKSKPTSTTVVTSTSPKKPEAPLSTDPIKAAIQKSIRGLKTQRA